LIDIFINSNKKMFISVYLYYKLHTEKKSPRCVKWSKASPLDIG